MDLQTKAGNNARGCTAKEFKEVMEVAKAKAKEGITAPIYIFDNATIHTSAVKDYPTLVSLGEVLFIPKWSPEFNKAIEHNHAHVQHAFLNAVRALPDGAELKPADAMKMLELAFFNTTTAEGVARDMTSLVSTLNAVVKAKGDRPPQHLM